MSLITPEERLLFAPRRPVPTSFLARRAQELTFSCARLLKQKHCAILGVARSSSPCAGVDRAGRSNSARSAGSRSSGGGSASDGSSSRRERRWQLQWERQRHGGGNGTAINPAFSYQMPMHLWTSISGINATLERVRISGDVERRPQLITIAFVFDGFHLGRLERSAIGAACAFGRTPLSGACRPFIGPTRLVALHRAAVGGRGRISRPGRVARRRARPARADRGASG